MVARRPERVLEPKGCKRNEGLGLGEEVLHTAPEASPSVRTAFIKAVRGNLLWLVTGTLVVGAVSVECLFRRSRSDALQQQANLAAAVLSDRTLGDAATLASRLRSIGEPVLAAGVADGEGRVVSASPEGGEVAALIRAAAQAAKPVYSKFVVEKGRESIDVVAVPLRPQGTPSGGTPVVVLRAGSDRMLRLAVLAFLAVFAWLAGGFCRSAIVRWFDCHVMAPVGRLSRLAGNREEIAARAGPNAEDNPELAEAPAEFHEILRHLVDAERRLRRIEREADSQLKKQEAGLGRKLRRAEDLAVTDALTGLRNRTFFQREFAGVVERQHGLRQDLAVVMMDVDHFKQLNDTLGHQAGDNLLRFLGELLRGAVRPSDHAIRYAGDEFLLLLPHVDGNQARLIVERIARLFGQFAVTLGTEKSVTLSAGIATLRSSGTEDPQKLLAAADAALYKAKRDGKNTVAVAGRG